MSKVSSYNDSNRIPNIKISDEQPRGICDDILGTSVLYTLPRDVIVLFLARMVRLFSFGFLAVMLVLYLEEIKISNYEMSLLFTLTLLGDMLISLVMTRLVWS